MKALRQAAAFHRYFKLANHSCSGAVLPRVDTHIQGRSRKRGVHSRTNACGEPTLASGRAARWIVHT
eukprot:2247591-Prymnesium_polylepis.1